MVLTNVSLFASKNIRYVKTTIQKEIHVTHYFFKIIKIVKKSVGIGFATDTLVKTGDMK